MCEIEKTKILKCGIYSLCCILEYFNIDYSMAYVDTLSASVKKGMSIMRLRHEAKKKGLDSVAFKCTIKELCTIIPFPAILYWPKKHFNIILGKSVNAIELKDNLRGNYSCVLSSFENKWCENSSDSGIVIVFSCEK
jgi:ABC-type bacteriocin/lantibiotic exporter with double-glycine peptidase domain